MFARRADKTETAKSLAADAMATAHLMIADADLNIVYINPAASALLREAEPEIRKDLPGFSVASLIGSRIDAIHKDPLEQGRTLAALQTRHRTTIRLGDRRFDLVATPLSAPGGRRIGLLLEWIDARPRLQMLDYAAQAAAISRVQAVIEFNLDGTIVTANDNFLDALGYSLDEIKGQHHRMFVEPAERESAEYRNFWAKLNRGDYDAGEFKRRGKDGREVWILASYNPVLDEQGKPFKIVKFATDVTAQKVHNAEIAGQLAAFDKALAMIEFNLDGTIVSANQNFLNAMGYTQAEIVGKHHSIFLPAAERDSADYRAFWAALRRGEYQAGEFRRVGKAGNDVWIQASYNPILDLAGRPFKVVKCATDTTQQVLARRKSEHVRGMMESVAAGAETLSASVSDISRAMEQSREISSNAVSHVGSADQRAQRLDEAAQAMSGIVELIANITSQINLLALNATIESARAGDAGRGFAVVAAEVKNLANQAKQATDRINQEIESLNGISRDVVAALATIRDSIQSVNEYVGSTAISVEQQNTVTREMSENMRRAAAEAASLI